MIIAGAQLHLVHLPSESVSTSMRPLNIALNMVSCFVSVPIVV